MTHQFRGIQNSIGRKKSKRILPVCCPPRAYAINGQANQRPMDNFPDLTDPLPLPPPALLHHSLRQIPDPRDHGGIFLIAHDVAVVEIGDQPGVTVHPTGRQLSPQRAAIDKARSFS